MKSITLRVHGALRLTALCLRWSFSASILHSAFRQPESFIQLIFIAALYSLVGFLSPGQMALHEDLKALKARPLSTISGRLGSVTISRHSENNFRLAESSCRSVGLLKSGRQAPASSLGSH